MDIFYLAAVHPLLSFLLVLLAATLATLRLTRFVTTDTLGGWWLTEPLESWAERAEIVKAKAIEKVIADVTEEQGEAYEASLDYLLDLQSKISLGEPVSWQRRLVSGLRCPFCVGFWIGLLVLALTLAILPFPWISLGWYLILAALSMNYVVGHIASRLD